MQRLHHHRYLLPRSRKPPCRSHFQLSVSKPQASEYLILIAPLAFAVLDHFMLIEDSALVAAQYLP